MTTARRRIQWLFWIAAIVAAGVWVEVALTARMLFRKSEQEREKEAVDSFLDEFEAAAEKKKAPRLTFQ